jgi:hypothetical protein
MAHETLWFRFVGLGRSGASDWLLGGAGVSAAALSASFACYMVAVGPAPRLADPKDTDFRIFANFDRRAHRDPPAVPAVLQPLPSAVEVPKQAASTNPQIDYTPTGSIGPAPTRTGLTDAMAGSGTPAGMSGHRLPGLTVHDVFDGKAVVEVRNRLTIVEPGSVVEGAGEVLAIRREGTGWVVETANGEIGQ